jgi:hypothetical protein
MRRTYLNELGSRPRTPDVFRKGTDKGEGSGQ